MNLNNASNIKIDELGEVSSLSILTVIDNDIVKDDLETCWGLSFYIEFNNDLKNSILMDCSGSLYDYSQNISKLNLKEKISQLNAVHISHWHYDHAGNLNYVLTMIPKSTPIYVPLGNTRAIEEIRAHGFYPVELDKPRKIFEGVLSTGTLKKNIAEHSLVFNVKEKGLVIVLGCAHPGVISIIEKSRNISSVSKVYGVIGGFHINNVSETKELISYLKKLEIQLVSPCHCTGKRTKEIIRKEFKNQYVKNGSGLIIST